MSEPKDEDRPRRRGGRERVRQLVASLVDGTGLHVQEMANGLAITNPHDPERGQVHVAFDGYVCWEKVTWDFWGMIEGFAECPSTTRYPWDEGTGETVVTRAQLVEVLGHPSD
jgi:hypothetical protein